MESYFVRFLTYMFAVWWGMLIERDSYTDHMKSLCSMKNYHVTHPSPYSPEPYRFGTIAGSPGTASRRS